MMSHSFNFTFCGSCNQGLVKCVIFCYHSKQAAIAEIRSTAARGHEVKYVRRSSKEGARKGPWSRWIREAAQTGQIFFPDRLQWKLRIGHCMPCIPAFHSFQVCLRPLHIRAAGDIADACRRLFPLRSETVATSAVKKHKQVYYLRLVQASRTLHRQDIVHGYAQTCCNKLIIVQLFSLHAGRVSGRQTRPG